MIDPDSDEGRRVQRLLKQAVKDVRIDKAICLAKRIPQGRRDSKAWAKITHTAVTRLAPEDVNKVLPRLRKLCEHDGLPYPFAESDEEVLVEAMLNETKAEPAAKS